MDILLRLVNLAEEVGAHKGVVALRMLFRQSYILIHIEGYHIAERKLSRLNHSCEFGISLDRGRTCAESEHEWLVCNGSLGLNLLCNVVSGPD